jgi:hypothetical protein
MSGSVGKKRRAFRWQKEARDLVRAYHQNGNADLKVLVARLAAQSGNPKDACLRFVRRIGPKSTKQYRIWTVTEQQRLLDLIACQPVAEVAKVMRRSQASVRSMLHRLGAGAQIGPDWFTQYALAEALHIRPQEVQKWIERGWLQASPVETGGLKKTIIRADAFSEFCDAYLSAIVGRRLNVDRIEFVRTFVFARGNTALSPVPESKSDRVGDRARVGRKPVAGHSPVEEKIDDTSSVA